MSKLTHIHIRQKAVSHNFTGTGGGSKSYIPKQDASVHGVHLLKAINAARESYISNNSSVSEVASSVTIDKGFVLEFQAVTNSSIPCKSLVSNTAKKENLELLKTNSDNEGNITSAIVYIPENKKDYLDKKINKYLLDKPKEEANRKSRALINSIENIVPVLDIRKLWKDQRALDSNEDKISDFEVWLRNDCIENFRKVAEDIGDITISDYSLFFPDGEVCLVRCSLKSLRKLELITKAISGFRFPESPVSVFSNASPSAQQDFANTLRARVGNSSDNTAVCILDTGIHITHSLLSNFINDKDIDAYHPDWDKHDQDGHGTQMAGLALYGDLKSLLESQEAIIIDHKLESIKIHNQESTRPELLGHITKEASSRAEINNPKRSRVFCLSLTDPSPNSGQSGQPSSWSTTIDQLTCGVSLANVLERKFIVNDNDKKLFFISAGNVRGNLKKDEYPERNEVEPIESPGQSWNAITVGACTQKIMVNDPDFDEHCIVAKDGDLSPTSRTSILWNKSYWPIKPEIVFEGGNYITDPNSNAAYSIPDLSILTTSKTTPFTFTNATSAANAQAARLGALIKSKYANYWPETIRALIIHSASWHPTMLHGMPLNKFKEQPENNKLSVLQKFGYGMPNVERALHSAINRAYIVFEDYVQPFAEDRSLNKMNFHKLPWPIEKLKGLQLGTEVKVKVTLSYFIEPNPASLENSLRSQFSYASHGLRFEFQRTGESDDVFMKRINKYMREEDYEKPRSSGTEWVIGRKRNRGSIISDIWLSTGQELAEQDSIAIFPQGGWWKDRKLFKDYQQRVRYSLIVSLEVDEEVDIHTPISQKAEIINNSIVEV